MRFIQNECGDPIPEEIINNAIRIIEKERGLKLIKHFRKYIYRDGKYCKKGYPSSATGIKGTRFGVEYSYTENKIYLDDENKYCIFLSPSYGGINVHDNYIPYRH
jgi:hypothetical protein